MSYNTAAIRELVQAAFYRHIPLPPHYVPRPDLLDQVKRSLLASQAGLALTSAIEVKSVKAEALHGMGGIGKSVVARVLCEDVEIQETFPDGIL